MGKARSRNPRITKRDRGLLEGAIRRVFSRSELRRKILEKSLVKEYQDPSRKRVTRWGKCAECGKIEAAYQLEIDHEPPRIRLDESSSELTLDELVDRAWCDESKMRAICQPCHKIKSALENKERRRIKKERNEKI